MKRPLFKLSYVCRHVDELLQQQYSCGKSRFQHFRKLAKRPQVSYFYDSYDSISEACTAFDNQVEKDSKAADPSDGEDYYALTALATRQAFGALEYTNTPTTPWVFLKEISSDGDTQTVSHHLEHKLLIHEECEIDFTIAPADRLTSEDRWMSSFRSTRLPSMPMLPFCVIC